MKKIIWILSLFLVTLIACGEEEQTLEEKENILPKEFVDTFLEGEFERIYQQTSDEFQNIVTYDQFEQLGKEFNHGVEKYELDLELPELGEYQWISNSGDKGIAARFSDDHTITGIQLIPLRSFPEQDQQFSQNKYQMPVNDEWFVYWGGTNVINNYHYALVEQRYAYDLIIIQDGSSYEGEATKNENYYAFGKEVVAPAAGVVVSIENDLKDNQPGIETDTAHPLGNHVVIQHEHDEYSFIAHLKKGSIVVSEGDRLEAGDLLGQVGNSGNTSEPHIHFQVSDGPQIETSKSIRIQFEGDEIPVRGDIVTGF